MKGLPFVLLFTALTFVSWGAYGPVLHHGADALDHDSMRAFVGVGLAYFLIAVIIPFLVLSKKGEKGRWTISGTLYSLVAGGVGALGALGIILALGYGGMAVYVMPLVFGFAPVVNTLVTACLSRTFDQISSVFVGGIVAAALGAAGVLYFKPVPGATTDDGTSEQVQDVGDPANSDGDPAAAESGNATSNDPGPEIGSESELKAINSDSSETSPSETSSPDTGDSQTDPPETDALARNESEEGSSATEPPNSSQETNSSKGTEPKQPSASEESNPPTEAPSAPAERPPSPKRSGQPSDNSSSDDESSQDTSSGDSDPDVSRELGESKESAENAPDAEETPGDETESSDPADSDADGGHTSTKRAVNVLGIIFSIVMAALCWGSYGPMLHIGQAKMDGSRLRPFACVGIAYFLIAVVAPLMLIYSRPEDSGAWTMAGMSWSFLAGVAGAIGALGVILAFNAGGKPYYVMPLIFGFAPVINTFISLSQAGTWAQVQPMFWFSLAVVIAGAVTVLVTAPKTKPKPATT